MHLCYILILHKSADKAYIVSNGVVQQYTADFNPEQEQRRDQDIFHPGHNIDLLCPFLFYFTLKGKYRIWRGHMPHYSGNAF